MDWLDKVSIVLIIALSILTLGMVVNKSINDQLHIEKETGNSIKIKKIMSRPDPRVYSEVEALIKSKNYTNASEKLQQIIEKYPQKPGSHLYMAKILMEQGNMGKSISLYRKSIETAPQFLEFASADLWELVKQGIPKMQREKKLKPHDESIKRILGDLYFLQRKLGQGCE